MKTRLLRIACGLLLTLALTGCAGADAIVLPDAAEVTAVRVTAGDAVTLHTDRTWIEGFLQQAAEAVSTGGESVQDAPDQPGAVRVELGTSETPDWSGWHLLSGAALCGHLPGGRGPLDIPGGWRRAVHSRGHGRLAGGDSMWKLIGGLLALPVLLVLSVLMIFLGSEDYTRIIRLNWELDLPASEDCLYETDSGASFGGDGERYHVLEYSSDSQLQETLEQEATPISPAEEAVTAILDGLSVPADQRPDYADCRWFTAFRSEDARDELYLLANSGGTRLYVIESLF